MSTHIVEACVIGIGISLEFRLPLRISCVCPGNWLGTASPVVEPSLKNIYTSEMLSIVGERERTTGQ